MFNAHEDPAWAWKRNFYYQLFRFYDSYNVMTGIRYMIMRVVIVYTYGGERSGDHSRAQ